MAISNEYRSQMSAEHHGTNWGSTGGKNAGDFVLEYLRKQPRIMTVLDFGAGKQSLETYVQSRFPRKLKWTNYDPGIAGIDKFPTGQFDLVVTSDVLEHVEPHLLDETLHELRDLTGICLINNIPCYAANHVFIQGPYVGKDVHLTIENPRWWRKKLRQELRMYEHTFEFTVNARQKRGIMRVKTRCFMVHEKT